MKKLTVLKIQIRFAGLDFFPPLVLLACVFRLAFRTPKLLIIDLAELHSRINAQRLDTQQL